MNILCVSESIKSMAFYFLSLPVFFNWNRSINNTETQKKMLEFFEEKNDNRLRDIIKNNPPIL